MKHLATTIFAFTLIVSSAVRAETAQQFLDERTDGERFAYLYGALEMAMVINKQQGNPEISTCIRDWFGNQSDKANKELMGALHQVKGKGYTASNIIYILINRHCGDAGAANAQSQSQSE